MSNEKECMEYSLSLVSIVIPFYNTDLSLFKQCIDSILKQTYSKLEIIVINDGSDEIKTVHAEAYVKSFDNVVFISIPNSGVSYARNVGIKAATGKYITFIDSDDVISPYMVEHAIELLEKENLDAVIGKISKMKDVPTFELKTKPNYNILDGDLCKFVFSDGYKEFEKEGWYISFQAPVARVIKTELVKKVDFPVGIKISEDTIWNYLMLRNYIKDIGIIDDNWYGYIQNEESALNRYSPSIIKKVVDAICLFNNLLEKNYSTEYMNWIFTKIRQIIFSYYLHPQNINSISEKKRDYKNLMKREPFSSLMKMRKEYGIKTNIRIMLLRSSFALDYYRR